MGLFSNFLIFFTCYKAFKNIHFKGYNPLIRHSTLYLNKALEFHMQVLEFHMQVLMLISNILMSIYVLKDFLTV